VAVVGLVVNPAVAKDDANTRTAAQGRRSAVLPFCRSAVLPFCRSAVLPFCRSAVLPFCRSAVRSRALRRYFAPPAVCLSR
jgi:hypothetical protein